LGSGKRRDQQVQPPFLGTRRGSARNRRRRAVLGFRRVQFHDRFDPACRRRDPLTGRSIRMSWAFSTEPEFEKKLAWIPEFVSEEVEPLGVLFRGCEFLPLNDERRRIVDPLKQQVRDNGLWAPHLGPELGGQGFGAVKLTLINEILGRSPWAPIVFGTQAPDTGNAEILARFGTQGQKDRYLTGLLSGEIFSCFSMTEPEGGAAPRVFTPRPVRDGNDWVITGRNSFPPNPSVASFFIVVPIPDAQVPVHRGASTFLFPAG